MRREYTAEYYLEREEERYTILAVDDNGDLSPVELDVETSEGINKITVTLNDWFCDHCDETYGAFTPAIELDDEGYLYLDGFRICLAKDIEATDYAAKYIMIAASNSLKILLPADPKTDGTGHYIRAAKHIQMDDILDVVREM